jgi:hypothetical protein
MIWNFPELEDLLEDFECNQCGYNHITCRCGLEEEE